MDEVGSILYLIYLFIYKSVFYSMAKLEFYVRINEYFFLL